MDALRLQANPGIPEVENQPPVGNNPGPEPEGSSVPSRPEEADETWDSKEDKIHNAENIQPAEQKYEHKSGMQEEGLRGLSTLVRVPSDNSMVSSPHLPYRSVEASKP